MFRRCVSLLVIAGLIAGQSVSLPHAHGEMSAAEKREHDATPHFHCAGTGHSHHHGHSHGPHSHSHAGHSHVPSPSVAVSKTTATPDGLNRCSHDEDAVYILPSPLATSVKHSSADASNLHVDDWAVDVLVEDFNSVQWTARWRPPDQFRKSADLYLVLRNLRI